MVWWLGRRTRDQQHVAGSTPGLFAAMHATSLHGATENDGPNCTQRNERKKCDVRINAASILAFWPSRLVRQLHCCLRTFLVWCASLALRVLRWVETGL